MIFDWVFKKNSIFEKFQKELKNAEFLDRILDNLLEDKPGYEKSIRKRIQSAISNLNLYILNFNNKLEQQKDILNSYIITSIEQVNYLFEIKKIINEIVSTLNSIKEKFDKDDYLIFVDETIQLRNKLKNEIQILEEIMKKFHEQSKNSLEWLYEKGSNNIDENRFLNKVRSLGGIKETKSRGSHYNISFKLFDNTIGPSQKNKGQIAAGTLKSFIQIREKVISPYLNPKYLLCYFYKKNKKFENVFLTKYKHLFKL